MGYDTLADLHRGEVAGIKTSYLTEESAEVNKLNDQIIKNFYFTDIAGPNDSLLKINKLVSTFYNPYFKSIQKICSSIDSKKFVIKDPRFCLTLPWWINSLTKNYQIKIIWVSREQEKTLKSWLNDPWCHAELKFKNDKQALDLINRYNFCLNYQKQVYSDKFQFYDFCIDKLREEPEKNLKQMSLFLNCERKIDSLISSIVN